MSNGQFFTLIAIAYMAPHIPAKVAMPLGLVSILLAILYFWVI